jgi:hypothetical protein
VSRSKKIWADDVAERLRSVRRYTAPIEKMRTLNAIGMAR